MPTMDAKVLTDEADGLDALSAALGGRRSGSGRPCAVRPVPAAQPIGAPPALSAPRPHVVV
jgi:hypothetical protein